MMLFGKAKLTDPGDISRNVPFEMQPVPLPKKKGGGFLRSFAGSLGDILLQDSGMQPQYAPRRLLERQAQLELENAQRDREARMADWQAQEEWKRANPTPAPTEFERILASSGLPTEEQQALLQQYARSKANPTEWIRTQNPDGTITIVPMGGAPQAPVGKLRPVGGQTPAASGNFR